MTPSPADDPPCAFVYPGEVCGENESHWRHGPGPGNELMRHAFRVRPIPADDPLRRLLREAADKLLDTPGFERADLRERIEVALRADSHDGEKES